ncbi:hypothetical protein SSZBM1_91 [Synechococcus phage S-SZBM1]|uniref:Uncharacterized protein n=1 Tax=Synechococcus phage S-SZBM1 TaxID=2926475 RepID=A0AC61TSK6_9CAUD|nr:hypothetical protein PP650_gp185 [Synechococcus phage S-SZBM1]UNH61208.1 hypothetical protein SSZBM1_91 [Synechococcus phage S-SZBM1]
MKEAQGFGSTRADRSLMQSARELAALHKVLRKYPQDSKGRRKMLKQIKKYYRGPLAEIDRIDMKPVNFPEKEELMFTDEEVQQAEAEAVTEAQAQALRESLSKD